ncbi:hypothetical protein F5Y10DRAFT_244937 [Nemania abortiva]|nr:hypothetical protein F5Y10DRAFT_244937 [Nemania abortiva]
MPFAHPPLPVVMHQVRAASASRRSIGGLARLVCNWKRVALLRSEYFDPNVTHRWPGIDVVRPPLHHIALNKFGENNRHRKPRIESRWPTAKGETPCDAIPVPWKIEDQYGALYAEPEANVGPEESVRVFHPREPVGLGRSTYSTNLPTMGSTQIEQRDGLHTGPTYQLPRQTLTFNAKFPTGKQYPIFEYQQLRSGSPP